MLVLVGLLFSGSLAISTDWGTPSVMGCWLPAEVRAEILLGGGADARMLEAAEENWPVGADVQAWCLELSIKSAGCGLV